MSMMMMMRVVFVLGVTAVSFTTAFLPSTPAAATKYANSNNNMLKNKQPTTTTTTTSSSSSSLMMMMMPEELVPSIATATTSLLADANIPLPDSVEEARTAFFSWFFGASGGAGIARSAFPRMYKSARLIQGLKDEGPTAGQGETLGLSPLVGYPRDLYISDVNQVLNNKLSVNEMVEKYPIENNFLSARGYLTYAAYAQANAKANPLTVRAIFDTFSTSTDVVNPDKAQALLDAYKQDISQIKSNLLVAKLIGYASIFALLFLLGLADIVAAGHAYNGWFPTWPGGVNFPFSIFTQEGSLFTIPAYWI